VENLYERNTLEDLSIYENSINRDVTRTVWKDVNWFQLAHNMKRRKFMKTSYHKIPALVCNNFINPTASYRKKSMILSYEHDTRQLVGWLIS
jgi:hypothetical protein